jgi:hypothetical protein
VKSHVGNETIVSSRPLIWDGLELSLGEPVVERVSDPIRGSTNEPGTVVSLHWDYVCEELDQRQLAHLQHQTSLHLAIANRGPRELQRVIER